MKAIHVVGLVSGAFLASAVVSLTVRQMGRPVEAEEVRQHLATPTATASPTRPPATATPTAATRQPSPTPAGAASTPPFAQPTFTPPTPRPAPAPAPLAWTRVTVTDYDIAYNQQFFLDADSGELWALSRLLRQPEYIESPYRLMAWAPDGQALVLADRNPIPGMTSGAFELYAARPGKDFDKVITLDWRPRDAAYSPDGRYLALVGETRMAVFDVTAKRISFTDMRIRGQQLSWSVDGQYVVVAGSGNEDRETLTLWRTTTGDVRTIKGAQPSWSATGHLLAYVVPAAARPADGHSVSVYDPDSGRETAIGPGSQGLRWSADGRYLSAAVYEESVPYTRVYDLTGQSTTVKISGAQPLFWQGASLFMTGNYCATFDLTSYSPGAGLRQHAARGDHASLSPDGQRVAVHNFQNEVQVLDLASGKARVLKLGTYLGFGSFNGRGDWSPDGRFVVLQSIGGSCGPCMGGTPVPTAILP